MICLVSHHRAGLGFDAFELAKVDKLGDVLVIRGLLSVYNI